MRTSILNLRVMQAILWRRAHDSKAEVEGRFLGDVFAAGSFGFHRDRHESDQLQLGGGRGRRSSVYFSAKSGEIP